MNLVTNTNLSDLGAFEKIMSSDEGGDIVLTNYYKAYDAQTDTHSILKASKLVTKTRKVGGEIDYLTTVLKYYKGGVEVTSKTCVKNEL